jgi:phosphotriesterase-related protein
VTATTGRRRNTVSSVTGEIEVSRLGLTLVHEHLRTGREAVYAQFPHLLDEPAVLSTAIEQVNAAGAVGVKTICEPTVMGLDRNIRFMRKVAEATGMQIIAATGIYTFDEVPPYFATRSVDHMAEAFVHDIEVGIQGTEIRAAFLKCATDSPGVTSGVEMVLRAVARAHRRTGAPILTHSYPANRSGADQQDIFESEGVDLRRVMIGHSGDTDDLDYLERIAERGSYLGMDRFGLDDVLPMRARIETVAELCRRGYASRLFLSQDHVCVFDRGFPEAVAARRRDASLVLVINEVVPRLRELGVEQSSIDLMLAGNVQAWLPTETTVPAAG